MNREIMQQALTALRISTPFAYALEYYEFRNKAIKDIEAELAKPEQEPVFYSGNGTAGVQNKTKPTGFFFQMPPKPEQEPQMIQIKDGQLSYIKKPWVGLTDEEIKGILDCGRGGLVDIKKAEQILKEKNT